MNNNFRYIDTSLLCYFFPRCRYTAFPLPTFVPSTNSITNENKKDSRTTKKKPAQMH